MKLVNKRSNFLVSFSVFLNFAKTEANTIVKGSLIVNTGRGRKGLQLYPSWTHFFNPSNFLVFFCLGSLIIYDLGGVEVVESKDFVWVPSPRLCSILMIPLIGRHPLPILYPFIAKTDPTSLPPKKRKIPPPEKKEAPLPIDDI